jgi:transposase
LGLSWQRARSYIRSPDPDYEAKLADITWLRAQARRGEGLVVLIYLDEVTIYRQPTLAPAWAPRRAQPRARRSRRSDTPTRLVGGLDAQTGRVVRLRAGRIGVAELVRFYRQLVAAYPPGTRFFVAQDNWPVHWHPDLLVALEPQRSPWPRPLPPSWAPTPSPAAVRRWGQLQLPIQIVPLPTYASWLNPIEKLWRLLRQELTHVHPYAEDLPALRAAIDAVLDRFATGSARLLRYVGLAPHAEPRAA